MTMVAVTTLRDAAGADVAKEALADHGIAVEIKRLGSNAYFGSPTAEEFEVRVPADRVDDAHKILELLAEELEQQVLAEAGVPPETDPVHGSSELPPPDKRPRKVSWAIALGLVGPLPGCGLLYARAFRLGWSFFALTIALFVGGIAAGSGDTLAMIGVLKGLDIVMAPFFAARFNKKLLEEESRTSYAARA
ncbi:MAG: hypothetical protein JWN44_362 [Myxococcales bacterium]|nr:hypothetical protein [Myxococcales bacterium]